jgi:UDP:flavonoid glycosyltransferase YjiC (YdhE family)
MDKMSLVITHAGHGTVMSALSHGIPMVCLPMVNDEPLVAERVASLGAGVSVSPSADEESIRAAILKVLHEPSYQSAAQHLRSIMDNGAELAVKELERLQRV